MKKNKRALFSLYSFAAFSLALGMAEKSFSQTVSSENEAHAPSTATLEKLAAPALTPSQRKADEEAEEDKIKPPSQEDIVQEAEEMPKEKPKKIEKAKLERQAEKIEEEEKTSQNQPDYSLVVYPQIGWKAPPDLQPGWQSYYLQVRFLLKGGLSHRMSDVSSLSIDSFEAGKLGGVKEREETAIQALNAIFTDEGTTGKAHATQNGLTNIYLNAKGHVHVKRSALCVYDMALAHTTTTKDMMRLIFLPEINLPERCGDVPVGMELEIVSGPHEELLQKLYCDDFPSASYCSPNADHWTVPEFKQS